MALTLGIDVAVRSTHQAMLARDGATVWRGRKLSAIPGASSDGVERLRCQAVKPAAFESTYWSAILCHSECFAVHSIGADPRVLGPTCR